VETTEFEVLGIDGKALKGTRGLIWGNNASWLCVGCDRLSGNRTGETEFRVTCPCGHKYEILRSPNKNGSLDLGPATGVRQQ
jgi:hypothetical protein